MNPQSSIAHYRITTKLGEGGMGAVYRATDTKLNRDVAIKVLPDTFANDPDRLARFTREAQVLASLNHPNIAVIHGVEERALVMELVEGPTLAERIAQRLIPLDEAIPIARQIAEAPEYAHEKGIVHRDLKPANVKVTPEGRVKVLDFGLAKALLAEPPAGDPAASPTLTMRATMAGTIIGTAGYMSPEQAKGKPVDCRADIWAYGCVLYEMLTGRPAFAGDGISEILAAVIKDQPDLDAAPTAYRPIIERCLRKDLRMRWQSIGDVRVALEEPAPAPAPQTVAVVPGRRHWLPWAVAGMALALAAALAVVHFRQPRAPREVIRFQVPPPEKGAFGPAFALSPDGRMLAFSATDANGRSFLWVRPLNSLEPKPLPATEGATFLPVWSPDGRFLLFSTQGKVKKVDVAGGPAQVICDVAQVVVGGSWSPSGEIVFSFNDSVIFKVPAAGGTAVPITRIQPGESFHSHPFFLPDGRHFLYTRNSQNPTESGIYAGTVDAKPEEKPRRKLVDAQYALYAPGESRDHGYILLLRDRTLLAQPFDASRLEISGETVPVADDVGQYVIRGLFSVSATGALAYQGGSAAGTASNLAWYDRHGAVVGPLGETGHYRMPVISPDGTRVAVRRQDPSSGNQDIWIFDLVRGGSSRFTFSPATEESPVWSPDGSQIAFDSYQGGTGDLYRKSSSMAGKEELLVHSGAQKKPYSWSPDGRYLLYEVLDPKTSFDLWLLPNPGEPGSHSPVPFLRTEFRETQGQFSPDGRWVAYVSDASGRPEVYVRPFPPSADNAAQWMISNGGGVQPRWNRNGKELLYFNSRKLMSVEVSAAGVFRAGAPKALFETPLFGSGAVLTSQDWDISPDGSKFLVVTQLLENSAAPITVVLNWQEGLRK